MSRRRVLATASVIPLVVLAVAAPAEASGVLGTGIGPDVGPDLNPLPSAEGIGKHVINLLFVQLASALTPDFLKHGSVDALRWLVALPNPASTSRSPHLVELEGDMTAIGVALLPVTILVGAMRYWAAGITGAAHPVTVVARAVAIGAWLAGYRWAFSNGIALVNVVTNSILTLPVVDQGLARTVSVLFGSAVIVGGGGVLLALLTIVAVCLAVGLFAMKVVVLMLAAVLWAAGPLLFPLYLIPETAHFVKAWLVAAIATALIPLGWCVLFAVAGALALDVTSMGSLGHEGARQVVGEKTIGGLACLVTFYLAVRWPFVVLGQVRAVGAGFAMSGRGLSAGGARPPAAVAQAARARLRGAAAGTLAAGRVVGQAAGRLSPRAAMIAGGRRTIARTGAAVAGLPAAAAVGTAAAKTAATVRQRGREMSAQSTVARAGLEAATTLRTLPGEVRQAYRGERDRSRPATSSRQPAPHPHSLTSGGPRRPAARSATRVPRASRSSVSTQKRARVTDKPPKPLPREASPRPKRPPQDPPAPKPDPPRKP